MAMLEDYDRPPRAGDWFCVCCSEDLRQLKTSKDVREAIAWLKNDSAVSCGRWWPTLDDAVRDLIVMGDTKAGERAERLRSAETVKPEPTA